MANTHSLDLESGSSQYATAADAAALDGFSAMTLECWVKPESLPTDGDTDFFISKFVSGNDNASWQFRIANSGGTYTLYLAVVSNPSADELGVTYAISTGTWVHLAVTWLGSSKEMKFYVNGAQQGTTQTGSSITTINNSAAGVQIGARNAGLFYDGLIDEVRVWNVVRTEAQINDNKSVEIAADSTGLVAYWKLNNSAVDSQTNVTANDLTLQGSPSYSSDVPFTGSALKTVNGLAAASVKTKNGLAIASVKTINGLS